MFKELQNSSNYPIASSESKSLILVNIKKSRNQQNLFKIIFNLHRQTIFHFHLLIVRAVFQLQKIDFCSTDDINYYCLQCISSAPSKQCHFAPSMTHRFLTKRSELLRRSVSASAEMQTSSIDFFSAAIRRRGPETAQERMMSRKTHMNSMF